MEKRVLLLIVAILIISTSCSPQNLQEPNESLAPVDLPIYGTWIIDKIALTTEGYSGEIMGDVRKYETEGFVGSELEYTPEYFRWRENKYYPPVYETENITIEEYYGLIPVNHPSIYEFLENEGIKVDRMDEYENIREVPLVNYQVSCDQSNDEGFFAFIPVGANVYLLNDDTMLVGLYGHVFLAHKKSG